MIKQPMKCWAEGATNGCLIINSAVESNVLAGHINKEVNEFRKGLLSLFIKNLIAAKKNKEISVYSDPQVLGEFVHTYFEGMVLKSRTGLAKVDLKKSIKTLFETVTR